MNHNPYLSSTRPFKNRLVFALVMALFTASLVILVVVISQAGFSKQLFRLWLGSFVYDYPFVVLSIIIFAPILQNKLFKFNPGEEKPIRSSQIKFALTMAIITVSISCFFGLAISRGLNIELIGRFLTVFPIAYITAVPLIILIAPRLQKRVDKFM